MGLYGIYSLNGSMVQCGWLYQLIFKSTMELKKGRPVARNCCHDLPKNPAAHTDHPGDFGLHLRAYDVTAGSIGEARGQEG